MLSFDGQRMDQSLRWAVCITPSTAESHRCLVVLPAPSTGPMIFPARFREIVAQRLESEYFEGIDEWVDLLVELSDRSRYPQPVRLES